MNAPTAPGHTSAHDAHETSGVKVYQVSVMLLYFAYGFMFLLAGDRLSVTHVGAWFTATGPALEVWGLAFIVAAALVDWSLIDPHSKRVAAVATLAVLFVAGAWGVSGLAITVMYGVDPTRVVFWAWFVFVYLFVHATLAPRALAPRATLAAMPHVVYQALMDLQPHTGPHAPPEQHPAPAPVLGRRVEVTTTTYTPPLPSAPARS